MSRSAKLIAPVVALAVVGAFVAGLLIGQGGSSATTPIRRSVHVPNFGQTMALIDNGAVTRVTLDQRRSTMDIVLPSGKRYSTGYPNGYVSLLVKEIMRHEGPAALSVQSS